MNLENTEKASTPQSDQVLTLHKVQLKNIWLRSIDARRHDWADEALEETHESSLEFDGSIVDCSADKAQCELRIDLRAVGSEQEFGLDVTVSMRAHLQSGDTLDEQQWEAFAKLQVVLLLWPYVRELISTISTRMALPPLLLPVLEIPSPYREEHIEGQDE